MPVVLAAARERGAFPKTSTVPAVGWRLPPMQRNAVVFPDPLGPISAVRSPRPTSKERGDNALSFPNVRVSSRTTKACAGTLWSVFDTLPIIPRPTRSAGLSSAR